jgi:tetraacyldisaccharide 4'-kinase
VHFLLRGYGGRKRGPYRVAPSDTATDVGDEALLLAAIAPTWIGANRAASAQAAAAAGAQALLLDDGLQNPTLEKDLSLLVVDGASAFGNGRVLPAGPLREPIAAAAGRCQAAVLIGRRFVLPLPTLNARMVLSPQIEKLKGRRVLAFAGLALPDKFFTMLSRAGVILAASRAFPDHHAYVQDEIRQLVDDAARLDAEPVTTPKDAVRLTPEWRQRIHVVGVTLEWDEPAALEALLARYA